MFKEGEINRQEEPLKIIQEFPADNHESGAELSLEDKIVIALERQDAQLNFREKNCDKNILSGFKKWLGVATVLGASLLAAGCRAEKPNSGFTDNVHQNVQHRLEQQKRNIEHMKQMKNYKPGLEARQAAKDMQESQIIQPVDSDGAGMQKPGHNIEQGPTGKVMPDSEL